MKWILLAYLYGQLQLQAFHNLPECYAWTQVLNEYVDDAHARCIENWPLVEKD